MDKLLNREIEELQDRVNNLENLWANTHACSCTPKPTKTELQNYEDTFSSTETISKEAYKRLIAILDDGEYTRSDKEVPTPQPGDIWVDTGWGTRTTAVEVHRIEWIDHKSGVYYRVGNDNPVPLADLQYNIDGGYSDLVWRDGKRWDRV